jgi:TRAP-type uncharacterized transport system fused permease subunit
MTMIGLSQIGLKCSNSTLTEPRAGGPRVKVFAVAFWGEMYAGISVAFVSTSSIFTGSFLKKA